MASSKRVSVKLNHPNQLFEKWLTEWATEAKERNSNLHFAYTKALKSLQKFPLPLKTGKDCKILEGFGNKLCEMLDERLQRGDIMDHEDVENHPVNTAKGKNKRKQSPPTKSKRKANGEARKSAVKQYIPKYRSGAYAILMTLYKKHLEPDYTGFLNKAEVIRNGQHLCDQSFTRADPNSFYTAWSSMATLISKGLVSKQSSPPQFSLTPAGIALAEKISDMDASYMAGNKSNDAEKITDDAASSSDSTDDCRNGTSTEAQSSSSGSRTHSSSSIKTLSSETESSALEPIEETVFLQPHQFEIIMLVDHQETIGANNVLQDMTLAQLKNLNVAYEVRKLSVGDYMWICRDTAKSIELVLPYIVERKRMDDFAESIKGERFEEQKFRLKNCGIPNVTYVIESFGKNVFCGLPAEALSQAKMNILFHDRFMVQNTDNLQDTIQYLARFTAKLKSLFLSKTLMSCPRVTLPSCETSSIHDDLVPLMRFKEFNTDSIKQQDFTAKELFIQMLLVIDGVTIQKAIDITNQYPTVNSVMVAYDNTPESEQEHLLTNTVSGVDPELSRIIWQLFTLMEFE